MPSFGRVATQAIKKRASIGKRRATLAHLDTDYRRSVWVWKTLDIRYVEVDLASSHG